MKILYDHLGFMHKYGGVPKYYVELLKHFNSDIYTLLVLFSNNYYLELYSINRSQGAHLGTYLPTATT